MQKSGVVILLGIIIAGFFLGFAYQKFKAEEKYIEDNLKKGTVSNAALLLNIYDADTAIQEAERYLEEDPGNYDALIVLGWAHHFKQQYEDAIPHFEKAIDANPNHYSAFQGLASSYLYLEDYQKSIQFSHLTLSKEGNFGLETTYSGLGWSYYFIGDYESALEAFQSTEEFSFQTLGRQIGITLTYDALGMEEESAKMAEEVKAHPLSEKLKARPQYPKYEGCMKDKEYTPQHLAECGPLLFSR